MKEKLKEDLIKAMKEKDKEVLNTLRSLKGAIQLEVINNKKEETDELIFDIITKQIKMREASIEEFRKANREDLINSYQKEVNLLKAYMPKELSIDEVTNIINDVFNKLNPTSIKDLGSIMKEITPKVKNKFDMKKLNEMIRERLN
ncbi:MAG: GatB/YqeY domain-containing protein [Firmicutes bacterium]|nr:GatB/YqeY domain-containing protein [Bacillota bacterium]